jgi:hypothetical protein
MSKQDVDVGGRSKFSHFNSDVQNMFLGKHVQEMTLRLQTLLRTNSSFGTAGAPGRQWLHSSFVFAIRHPPPSPLLCPRMQAWPVILLLL